MKHLNEEQIVLHFYGDAGNDEAIERHLEVCAECRAEFAKVKALLAEIPATPVPEPPAYLDQKVWLHLRDRLVEEKSPAWNRLFAPSKWAVAGLVAILVMAAFLAGRFWPHHDDHGAPEFAQANPSRVVLVAVGDHLERSQMLLIEIMNAGSKDGAGIAGNQELARNLLDDNRLYRQSAQRTGDPEVARVLDELERVLVEIANSPPDLNPANAREIRSRIQSQDLLFKIHVLGTRISRPEAQKISPSASQRL
jgi:hypothetical protein